ncbi:MAG: magnesium transporter [Thermodesulfobacteriota bacterium]|nr:magnesium transporter [Thermodesulfobacteriota bacterium]
MATDRSKILIESIRRLLRRGSVTHLRKIVNKTHAADLAMVFLSLPYSDQRRLFDMIDSVEQKGILFSTLDESIVPSLIDRLDLDDVVAVFQNMPSDDVAAILGLLPEEKADAILEKMGKEDSEEVEGLLTYRENTAGAIMLPDFVALKETCTAREAIESLQSEYIDVEMPFYLYVVDEYKRLVGVISLRQLVVVPPHTPLKDFMVTDVYAVTTDTHQEDVAKIVARYDFLAVPVVDEKNTLVGIVTVDDVIDVFREEATEDILKMAGVGDTFVETQSVWRSTKTRLPWLFASCLGGIAAFFIIGYFEETLSKFAYIAAFIPVIMGMGGNVGTQSCTIVVRGLATNRLNVSDLGAVVLKELSVGLILGLFYGALIGIVAQVSYSTWGFALSVGVAVLSSMSVAALVGSMIPMTFARLKIDPAVATGPFVTTSIDILSVFFYFVIATYMLGL